MVTLLFHMWTKHNLRPGAFWALPKGERMLLQSFTLHELDILSKPTPGVQPAAHRTRRVKSNG
ncbi:hypothetical protein [Paenibacillus apii]|uniref:hypothetical protein n=1 Tax=Paenibacillus apii TaxID=1850370 RepID=UPI00143B650B|nr:hypothetical protein [Paenibacillus apii]NJJ37820.1 hypothetical protein [Paenibacillus apii]